MGTDLPSYPTSIQQEIYDESLYLTLMTKVDGKVSRGLILKIRDQFALADTLKKWESSMTNDLKQSFALTTTKVVSVGFLDNTYQGVAIRYRNFIDSNNTIDYAVINAPNGDTYLVITSSKAHIYAVIDRIGGIVPGK